jgi:hypothetical protein
VSVYMKREGCVFKGKVLSVVTGRDKALVMS